MSETLTESGGREARKLRLAAGGMGWVLLVFGVFMAAVAGIVLTRAWFTKDTVNGWIGGLLLLGGALVAVSGGMRIRPAAGERPEDFDAPRRSVIPKTPGALPRLGELLIYKYHLINEKDLQRALERQKEFAGRPVGEILVEMGRISWRDLARALEDQLSYGDPWKRKRK
jgi:hypothetical protein